MLIQQNSAALIHSAGCRWARRGVHAGGVVFSECEKKVGRRTFLADNTWSAFLILITDDLCMRTITKKAGLIVLVALGHSAFAQAATEPSNREVAVMAVAVGRACAELNPEKKYTLQNLLTNPASGEEPDLKAEIVKVDTSPELQTVISATQKSVKGNAMFMTSLCPSYAPIDSK